MEGRANKCRGAFCDGCDRPGLVGISRRDRGPIALGLYTAEGWAPAREGGSDRLRAADHARGVRGRSAASASAHAMLTDSRIIVLPKANLKDLLNKNADLFSFDLTTIAHRKPVPSIRKPVPPPVDCTLLTEERAAASNSSGLLPQRTHCYVRRPVDLLARRRA
jgi:hypothetical protein